MGAKVEALTWFVTCKCGHTFHAARKKVVCKQCGREWIIQSRSTIRIVVRAKRLGDCV